MMLFSGDTVFRDIHAADQATLSCIAEKAPFSCAAALRLMVKRIAFTTSPLMVSKHPPQPGDQVPGVVLQQLFP